MSCQESEVGRKKKGEREKDAKKPPPKEVPEKKSRNSTKRANRRGVNNGGRAECNPELLLLDVQCIGLYLYISGSAHLMVKMGSQD